jgi:hypothetical protein
MVPLNPRRAKIAQMPERISGFRGEFLWEWDIAERQLLQLANAFQVDDYDWRPGTTARSVSEVFVHIACGTFMLLEVFGTTAPADLYLDLPQTPVERLWALVRKNDELEHGVREKEKVMALLSRALASARETITRTDDAGLERSLPLLRRTHDSPPCLPAAARARPRTHGAAYRLHPSTWYAGAVARLETGSSLEITSWLAVHGGSMKTRFQITIPKDVRDVLAIPLF